jgi:hypothetical protein
LATLVLAATASPTRAQRPVAPEPLADNSFLIEEAYNQERGVVQHVFFFRHARGSGGWDLALTQEWPAWHARHQVSYSISLVHPGDPGLGAALGDLLVHYRYQLADGATALAPRLTVLLPTGSESHGATAGGVGLQAALPLSLRWSDRFTTHVNLGGSAIPSDRAVDGFVGAGLVFFLHPRVNVIVEGLGLVSRSTGAGSWSSRAIAAAGVRWGHDFSSGLQLVPGLGWSVVTGSNRGSGGPLAYLSVEYDFR